MNISPQSQILNLGNSFAQLDSHAPKRNTGSQESFNNEGVSSLHLIHESSKKDSVDKLLEKATEISTFGSITLNLISAPMRLLGDNNPVKKIINTLSTWGTRAYQMIYGISGMKIAHENKNPFLSFSFFIDCVASIISLRSFRLFNCIDNGIDGLTVGAMNHLKKHKFTNYTEGLKEITRAIKELFFEIKQSPKLLIENWNKTHGLAASGVLTLLSSLFGLSINEKLGGAVADSASAVSALALLHGKEAHEKNAGKGRFAGAVIDFVARVFTETVPKAMGLKDIEIFSKLRDCLHEISIICDRLGEYFFLKHTEEGSSYAV